MNMTFFYVESGQHQRTIVSPDHKQSALRFVRQILEEEAGVVLGFLTCVSHKPFDATNREELFFNTEVLCEELGI